MKFSNMRKIDISNIKTSLSTFFSNIPKPGMRNIKTALSVLACILFLKLLGRSHPFYACIASVICLQDTVENSYKTGKHRMIGTIIGGFTGMFFAMFEEHFDLISFMPILTAIGIILVIYICTLIKKPASVSISCIVLLAVMTNLRDTTPFLYALNRMLDTFIGILIAIIINKYIMPNEIND